MKKHSCCRRRATTRAACMLLPTLAFLLIPKCPLCVAAWIALLTGLTVSTTTAGHLRVAVIALSLAVPLLLVLHHRTRRVGSLRR